MGRVDGALARQLDFEEVVAAPPTRSELRLAVLSERSESKGPDKYKALEHRRHQAQIKARRLLDLVD